MRFLKAKAGIVAALVMVASPSQAVTFVLTDTGGVTGTPAQYGFAAAAAYWSSVLTNDVTVRLNLGFSALGEGIIGSTGSSNYSFTAADGEDQIRALGDSRLDAAVAAHLPMLDGNGALRVITSGYANPLTKQGVDVTTRIYDTDSSAGGCTGPSAQDSCNNRRLVATQANLKALDFSTFGLIPDAAITFSSAFNFDFDPTNGISAGSIDFIFVAIHEIGHALGFTSGVDRYDRAADTALTNRSGQNSILDLFRYSADADDLAPGGPALDWSVGTASYFSIDGGTPYIDDEGRIAYFSTGSTRGDGRQASHWKDSPAGTDQLGVLDPTAGRGQAGVVTAVDLAAMDAIGWNLNTDILDHPDYRFTTAQAFNLVAVPEPATWGLMTAGFAFIGAALRRRRRGTAVVATA